MHIIIEVYIAICILLLLFDIVFLILKNKKTNDYYPRNKSLEKQIRDELEQYHKQGSFSSDFIGNLEKKLSKTQNLITLMSVLDENPEEKDLFRNSIYTQIDEYAKKTDYEQAYYTYVISTLDYEHEKIPANFASKFINFLDSKSLYTFTNTMEAFYEFGEEYLLLQALDKVDERGHFYNQKLLIDGLLTAKVDFESFNKKLVENFERYTPYVQQSLLNFFRMNNYDIAKLCLRIMNDKQFDNEVRYTAMRYFVKFENDDARLYCMNLLRSQEEVHWVDQMLAIQVLEQFDDKFVRQTITEKISSPNWYVRLNSSDYLRRHNLSKDEIYDILKKKDKYADEILLYQYKDDDDMTKYIINTIQLLDLQDELANGSNSDKINLTPQMS